MKHEGKGQNPDPPAKKPRFQWWRRIVGNISRKIKDFEANRQQKKAAKTPEHITAGATKWMMRFTFVLAAVGALTLWVLKNQLSDTRTIQRAFVYVETFEITPVIDPSKPDQFTQLQFSARIKNSGSTQAKWAHYHINGLVLDTPIPNGFAYPDRDEKGNTVLDEKGKEGFYPPNSIQSTLPVGVSMNTIHAIQEQHLSHLYIYGWIKYSDIFDRTDRHVTLFCDEIFFDQAPISPGSPFHAPRWFPCPEHNCTDEQCPAN